MEYNVPQFVEEEAKIIGPFSLRDFFILFGAGLLSALFFFLFHLWLAVFFAVIVMGSAVALLLVRVNGRPLYTLALAALQFFWSPRLYLWQKEGLKPEELLREKPIAQKSAQSTQTIATPAKPQTLTAEKIKALTRQLDAPQAELEARGFSRAESPATKPTPSASAPAASERSQQLTPEKIKQWAQL